MSLASAWNSRVAPFSDVVELRVHQQLPQRALAGVDLVDGAVELGHQFVQLLVERIVLQQLARGALARVESRASSLRISASDALRFVEQRRVLQQFARRALARLQVGQHGVHALERRAHLLVQRVVVDQLAERALAVAHIGQQLLPFARDAVQPVVQLLVLQQLADVALALLHARQQVSTRLTMV